MLCHRCGSHVPDEAKTCQNCGQALGASPGTGTTSRPNSLVLRRRRRQQTHANLPFRVGSLIDERYEVQEVLGSGALGAVFKVVDQDLDMELALKIIQADYVADEDTIAELRKATRRVRKLNHSNIVRLFDEGVDGSIFYFTMQYLEGLTLRKIINLRREKKQLFNLQEVEPILHQIVEALEYAHTTTFHGYLKPQNIIVLPDLLKLTDFGIIQALPFDRLLLAQKKQPDSLVYLAPEITQGQSADGRADIFSLGVILGEMLTGRSDLDPRLASLHEINDEIHPLLDDVYSRAVASNPAHRYQHVSDLIADVTSILEYGELAEDEEVPTVIVDADLDMAYTDRGPALEEDPSESSELAIHNVHYNDGHDTMPAELLEGSPIEVSDSIMELSAIDAEMVELEEELEREGPPSARDFPAAGEVTPPPLPAGGPPPLPGSRSAGPPAPSIQFDGQSSKMSLSSEHKAAATPPPLPSAGKGGLLPPSLPELAPPPDSIAAGNPHQRTPQPPGGNGSARPPSPFGAPPQSGAPAPHPHEGADTIPAGATPQVPLSQPPPFPGAPGSGVGTPMPPMQGFQNAPFPPQEPEETGFSRAGMFFFVLGMILIFGTGGIGLYFKFYYLPQYNRNKKLHKQPGVTDPVMPASQADAGPAPTPKKAPTPPVLPPRPVKKAPPVLPAKKKAPPPRTKRPKPRPIKRRPRVVAKAPPPRRRVAPCPKGMAYIRKGGFRMGSAVDDKMRFGSEKKLQWTRTGAYCIDRFEYPGPGRRPRTGVSFSAAKNACEKIGKRLCTEQEWERACKGSRNIRYPYGDIFDDSRCNTRTKGDKNRSVTVSGRFRRCRSPYGIYDMSGNVSEWTSSLFSRGRTWRVVRGGSAHRPDWSVRCASRSSRPPGTRKSVLGFRCCANPKTP